VSAVGLVLRAGVRDLARGRWVLAYGVALAVIAELLFVFGGTGAQVVLSLLNATLLLVPLMALVFGTTHFYASRDFIELLLAQPLSRRAVFTGLYLGLALPLAGAFVAGVGIPLALHGSRGLAPMGALVALAVGGVLLTACFAGLAMLIALSTDDRLRGMSMALGAWFLLTIAYDGAVLGLVAVLGNWPLDRPLLLLMAANPVDVVRVLVLHSLDAAALLGFTGALFRRVFGTWTGPAVLTAVLVTWTALPFLAARHRFRRRDF
jgi:Cu-processing system permease protein